jgi:hypothetical protein
LITRNINKNCVDKQIRLLDKAVSQVNGKLEFDLGNESQTGWGGFTKIGLTQLARDGFAYSIHFDYLW